jgi:hypothetical protein
MKDYRANVAAVVEARSEWGILRVLRVFAMPSSRVPMEWE